MVQPVNTEVIHRAYAVADLKAKPGDGYGTKTKLLPDKIETANLITSVVHPLEFQLGVNGNPLFDVNFGMHVVTLDIDAPCTVVPSAQPGHYHLFIDKKITWSHYKNIMSALMSGGIVETGYAEAATKTGFTAVRIPGEELKVLPGVPETEMTRLKQHAQAVWDKFQMEVAMREIANLAPGAKLSKYAQEILDKYKDPKVENLEVPNYDEAEWIVIAAHTAIDVLGDLGADVVGTQDVELDPGYIWGLIEDPQQHVNELTTNE